MSLEAWGDEGDVMPLGCVSEESHVELQVAHDDLLEACMTLYIALNAIINRDSWDPERQRQAMERGRKALADHTPGGLKRLEVPK